MMKRIGRLAVLAVLTALTVLPAQAEDAGISITSADRNGSSATISGVAVAPGVAGPQSVGGENSDFDPAEVAEAAGINLVDATIEPIAGGMRFSWIMNSMLPDVPPEAVRYTWSFKIGNTQYQLQAKRTNLASITTAEDPVNHALQIPKGDFFQLRGACQTAYQGGPTAGCYHLAFLKGKFDVANKTVSIDLPFATRDQIGRIVAADFVPGAVIQENVTAGMSITAAFQAVVGNTSTSDYTNGWTPYHIGTSVQLGVSVAGQSPEAVDYPFPGNLNPDGTFSGSVDGLGGPLNTVYARACDGVNCVYTAVTL